MTSTPAPTPQSKRDFTREMESLSDEQMKAMIESDPRVRELMAKESIELDPRRDKLGYIWGLVLEIAELRAAIRKHQQQCGNNLCHENDKELWQTTIGLPAVDPLATLPDRSAFLTECGRYYDAKRKGCPYQPRSGLAAAQDTIVEECKSGNLVVLSLIAEQIVESLWDKFDRDITEDALKSDKGLDVLMEDIEKLTRIAGTLQRHHKLIMESMARKLAALAKKA